MTTPEPRYRVGCAGMFAIGTDYGVDDEDEAIASCDSPPGCEVYDTVTGKWIGPAHPDEIEDAKARLARRATPDEECAS